jgi:hypothetical protein
MAVTPLKFDTVTGVDESAVEPLPSWPLEFEPQQTTVPLDSNAHEWPSSVVTLVAWITPGTATGMAEPTPAPKAPRLPQHRTVPSDKRAQVDTKAAATATGSTQLPPKHAMAHGVAATQPPSFTHVSTALPEHCCAPN